MRWSYPQRTAVSIYLSRHLRRPNRYQDRRAIRLELRNNMFAAIPQNTPLVSSSSQSASPSTLFYQHSPETHHQHQNQVKYPENGHDSLSDFVTFVCQETDNTSQTAQVRYVGPVSILKGKNQFLG